MGRLTKTHPVNILRLPTVFIICVFINILVKYKWLKHSRPRIKIFQMEWCCFNGLEYTKQLQWIPKLRSHKVIFFLGVVKRQQKLGEMKTIIYNRSLSSVTLEYSKTKDTQCKNQWGNVTELLNRLPLLSNIEGKGTVVYYFYSQVSSHWAIIWHQREQWAGVKGKK